MNQSWIKCLVCGNISEDANQWIEDYKYDEEADDEIVWYKCPDCGNEDQDDFEIAD